jgi:AraC family transcriptional regulator
MEQRLPSGHLYGEMLGRREAAGFVLMETAYAPGLKLPRHSHEHAGFCFVLRGTFDRVYERTTLACGPSSLSFHPSDENHSERFNGAGARLFSIQTSQRLLERAREYSITLDDSAVFHGGLLAQLALRLYGEYRRMDDASPLAVEGLAFEIMAEASRRSVRSSESGSPAPRWLRQAVEILHAQFAEAPTLSAVAQAVGVHPVHLARTFRQHYRCTVGDYLRRLRVESACRALSTSDTPLAEVALLAGFASQSHLSTAVKQQTGMTPTEYRCAFRRR